MIRMETHTLRVLTDIWRNRWAPAQSKFSLLASPHRSRPELLSQPHDHQWALAGPTKAIAHIAWACRSKLKSMQS
eukprot:11146784-Alexandrium_andersonii.AAC.1